MDKLDIVSIFNEYGFIEINGYYYLANEESPDKLFIEDNRVKVVNHDRLTINCPNELNLFLDNLLNDYISSSLYKSKSSE